MVEPVVVIGGGLAGSEAAWQLAQRGYDVTLYEMRPVRTTGAHVSDRLAELVCSNSLGSNLPDRATGVLLNELRTLKSLLIHAAETSAVPAGGALAVDREMFAEHVTSALKRHPKIEIVREEVTTIPSGPAIIATGPLTSPALAQALIALTGEEHLYFYDAISPIVTAESIDMSIAFRASRYDRGDDDYINCPMNADEYRTFVEAVRNAETSTLRDFEREDPHFFEGCVPIEQLAKRGDDTLAYGPMRPVGLRDPRTGKRPAAVVQLRRDNIAGSLYNIVGFQTNIKWGAQEQILRLIPGLAEAEFVRMGQMHRNTFVNSPKLLGPTMQLRTRDDLYLAGQITGIEGYAGNIATGLLAAINLHRSGSGLEPFVLPITTMLGALAHYISSAEPKHFQPMKANFGILPELDERVRGKRDRYAAYAERAKADLDRCIRAAHDPKLLDELPDHSVPVTY
ncbi:MAG: methylenetetrahydrofolate--tRNA-(uracil(54)-C(5))-methyltransferase (FADH(2)-oxidizing) TrmFO [Chloroflexi bacterium]|nr:methylenetetrahydrofolate--tRNA-(uracil(54)-C(5))-methyltransferase (FADH(2)-oxidizing) TrmFO [Chloroflexota bacterium]